MLSIDIETYSSEDLAKVGVYKYAESPDFELLLFSYSKNHGEVQVIDVAQGEAIPSDIISDLTNPTVIKWAFNAQFERVCLSQYLKQYLHPKGWHCSMIWAAFLSLPQSLDGVGKALGIEKKKIESGKDLIKYFCMKKICRNLPKDNIDLWEQFKAYNKRDVEAEMEIQQKMSATPVPIREWENYEQDQLINDRGVMIDKEFVDGAIECSKSITTAAYKRAKDITGLDNPNSTAQLKGWLSQRGVETETLDKDAVNELLKTTSGDVKELLMLRKDMAKSSVKKYTVMQNAVCNDGRVHGMIRFYGSGRTGRFAGRLVQVQNLPQNHIKDLEGARKLVKSRNTQALEMLYDSPSSVLSELIRTAFVPKAGHRFIVADFSAIEARVLSWFAGEEWRSKVFAEGGDIYCASASKMFGVPVEKHGVNAHLRQKGKQAELACGYGGSVGAMKAMGALKLGLNESELMPIVTSWREANPKIVKFWYDVESAVNEVLDFGGVTKVGRVSFAMNGKNLHTILPSGRTLFYIKMEHGFSFMGINGVSKKWERIETYGAKLVENITQATARDLLTEAILRLKGYRIVMHVHDEVIIEVPDNKSSVDEICAVMSQTPDWSDGLLLNADGYECCFYRKD